MINLSTRELKYQSLINKHLENFKDKGFHLNENYKIYCEFCEYSIKIDRKHVKNQMESHLRSQRHIKNQYTKSRLNQIEKKNFLNFSNEKSNENFISKQSTFSNQDSQSFKISFLENQSKDNINLNKVNTQNLNNFNYFTKDNCFKDLKNFCQIDNFCKTYSNTCQINSKNTVVSKKLNENNFNLDITQSFKKDKLENVYSSSTLNKYDVNKKSKYIDKFSINENNYFSNSFNESLKQNTNNFFKECNKSLKISSSKFFKLNKKQNLKLGLIRELKCDYFFKNKSSENQVIAPLKMLRKTFTSNVLRPSLISNNILFSKLLKKDYSSNFPNSTLNEYESYKRLKIVEPAKHVMNVQFNRPEKANSIDVLMFDEIKDCFKKISRDKYFRSVILTAAGKIFCAGIDLHTFQSVIPENKTDSSRLALALRNKITDVQDCILSIAQCQKPIVAAINGKCIGAGMNILAFVDVRYCSKDAMFCIKEVALGLAADIGVLQGLPRLVGNQSYLREMIYTAKEVGPGEAKELGLVSKICDNDEILYDSALKLAESIAKRSPIAVQGSKVCLDYSLDHTVVDGLNFSSNWNMSMLQSDDIIKGSMSVLSKSEDKVEFDNL